MSSLQKYGVVLIVITSAQQFINLEWQGDQVFWGTMLVIGVFLVVFGGNGKELGGGIKYFEEEEKK